MFITVNHELGYKFIPPPITTCASFYVSSLFSLSLSFLSYMKSIFQDICSSSIISDY